MDREDFVAKCWKHLTIAALVVDDKDVFALCASEVSFGYGLHPGTRIVALGPCGDGLIG